MFSTKIPILVVIFVDIIFPFIVDSLSNMIMLRVVPRYIIALTKLAICAWLFYTEKPVQISFRVNNKYDPCKMWLNDV